MNGFGGEKQDLALGSFGASMGTWKKHLSTWAWMCSESHVHRRCKFGHPQCIDGN